MAEALNISKAEALGIVTFYPDFRRAPVDGRVLKLCRAESCQAMGCEDLVAHLEARHGIDVDGRSARRRGLRVETVYCLGNCALSPAALLDGAPVGRLDTRPPRRDRRSAQGVRPMSARIFVPADSAALSVGADAVAAALAAEARRRGVDLMIVRTGSRGLFWLEPLVEVERADGRIGYGPVAPGRRRLAVRRRLPGRRRASQGARPGRGHPLPRPPAAPRLRPLRRHRSAVARRLSQSRRLRGARARARPQRGRDRRRGRRLGPQGRGGAGFPTGIKWGAVRHANADQKYVVCNADEGDSGTFADRMLMEGDPFLVIEGMTIAALAVGATRATSTSAPNIRTPSTFSRAPSSAHARRGSLAPSISGSAHAFDIEPRLGAGAYVCGEETSMLESLEGKRGLVRAKPPLPALSGLFGKPTVINNMLSFASVPWILENGAKAYAEYGVGRSLGSQPFQLAGNVRFGGLVELAFGPTIRELVEGFGGGTRSGRPIRAVQVGGPLGAYFPKAARHAARLRVDDARQGHARPRRDRGLRRHGRHGAPGALRLRLLRQGELRQMHALPASARSRGMETVDKIVAGVDRPKNFAASARSLRGHDGRIALRARRADSAARPQRARPFPEDFAKAPPRAAAE